MSLQQKATFVLNALIQRYPHIDTFLEHTSPWQLLVATILSAQCTDARVNMVTPHLFARWPTAQAIRFAELHEVETMIHSTGLYHSKAKNILASANMLCEKFHGDVPRTLAELIQLPGVARKTANIVLWSSFGINEGIAVDTHVKRICYRLGLTANTNPVKVEQDLMQLFPQAEWGNINHRLVQFGRDVCIARTPQCPHCELLAVCLQREPPKA